MENYIRILYQIISKSRIETIYFFSIGFEMLKL